MFKFDSEGDGPRGGRDGALPSGLSSMPDMLARVLGAAPFGIEIASPSGTLYSNLDRAAAILHGSAEATTRTRRFSVSCAGDSYELSLVLDESEQIEIERDLSRRAWFDELTGLPNRGLMERSIRALIADGAAAFGLVFIDLDGFKHVNDYFGHAVGDQLLSRLSERLAANLRRSDLLARLSGDEFVLLVSPIAGVAALAEDVDWIAARIKEPFVIDGNEVCTSASIGVSVYPEHGRTYDQLLSNADRAMYRGKSRGKGAVTFFDSSIEHAAAEKTRLEQRLRLAIRDRRVCCAYQPKVDLRSGEICGVEVLMRWRDEDGLIQPPGDFLSLALELGLMDDLTHFILAETISSIDRINDAFGHDCSISVNVAARQAGNTEFMRSLVAALGDTGFADRFMLELTEEAFLSKGDFQAKVLPMIRAIGSRVSIDDFGVGYSSLSALADITADEIKVDRSFISEVHRRPRSQSILRAIEALGHSLGMSIVVEGVETFEELAYLQAATRINCAQGYYFSKPMLLEDLGSGTVRESELRSGAVGREPPSNRIVENRARLIGR